MSAERNHSYQGQRYWRNTDRLLFNSRARLMWGGLVLFWGLLAFQLVGGRHGLISLFTLDQAIETRGEEIRAARVEKLGLSERVEALREDPETQEQAAKVLHGYTPPGAIIFEFEDDTDPLLEPGETVDPDEF